MERALSAKGGVDIPASGSKESRESTDRNVCVTRLEREIAELVYALYGLTPEERTMPLCCHANREGNRHSKEEPTIKNTSAGTPT